MTGLDYESSCRHPQMGDKIHHIDYGYGRIVFRLLPGSEKSLVLFKPCTVRLHPWPGSPNKKRGWRLRWVNRSRFHNCTATGVY